MDAIDLLKTYPQFLEKWFGMVLEILASIYSNQKKILKHELRKLPQQ